MCIYGVYVFQEINISMGFIWFLLREPLRGEHLDEVCAVLRRSPLWG